MADDNFSPRASFSRMVVIVVAAVILAIGIAARGDTIRLRAEAGASGPTVALREIADLDGPLAERLGDATVHTFAGSAKEARLSMDSVRQALTDAGVNWGLVSLKGYGVCLLHRIDRTEDDTAPAARPEPTLAFASPEHEISLDDGGGLRALVLQKLATLAGAPLNELRIGFSDRDAALLARSTLAGRYEIEPHASGVGRVPLTIRCYERGELVETLSVAANVERRVTAVVARRTIGRGDRFTPDDVELREVFVHDPRGTPVANLALVIGQVAGSQLREGHPIYPSAIESPLLVRRGELITVRCLSGGLAIRTVARANADGRLDDLIEVRNESTRQTYAVTVTGHREATIDLGGATGPSSPAPSSNRQENVP